MIIIIIFSDFPAKSMDIEFFFQFGSNVGPEALDTFVPVNGDF